MKIQPFMRVIKVTMILLICLILEGYARTYGQGLTFSKKNSSISDVVREMRNQTGFDFFYDAKIFYDAKKIDINVQNANINDVLEKCFGGDYVYTIVNKIVTIRKNTLYDANTTTKRTQQNGRFIGRVTSSSAVPLVGATVEIPELNRTTMTDAQGNFTLDVPAGTYTLRVSYIGHEGFEKSTIALANGVTVTVNAMLIEGISEMDEVVVTALGITREEREIGYAQQTVSAEELSTAASTNWSEGLKGKVAGLNIINGNTGPINSQAIQLRGTTSLDAGGNNALIVIDGVPMNQETTSYGNNVGAAYGTEAPVDYGNAISELRQDDIESVSVLKGPSAAALYGSRAANGAVIITTKSGKKNQKLGIGFNSTALFDHIINWPNYQYEYGGGRLNALDANGELYYSWGDSGDGPHTNTPAAWGPKFEGQQFYQYDPKTQAMATERTAWKPYKNNMKDFYRTGMTFENSLALQGGDDKGSMRLNLSRTDNEYIAPNTGYKRNSVSFNGSYNITNRIKLSSTMNFNNRSSDNLPGFGMSNGSLGYFMMFLLPNVDINWYKPIWEEGKENVSQLNPFSAWSSNPYFLMHVDTNPLNSNQLVGNVSADIKLTDKLNFMGRVSYNSLSQLRETQRGYSSKKHLRGYYGRQDVSSQEINADFLLTYKDRISEDLDYTVVGGASKLTYEHRNVMSSIDALIVPGVYTLANGVNNPMVMTNDSKKHMNSLYGMFTLGWRNSIYLDITGRNDWSSTLPQNNNSYFYPSVSSSFILSELFSLPDPVSYFKYRLSYAKVGSDANPYQTSKYYSQSGFASSAIMPSVMFNADLKPEITSSWETGFDVRFFNNRLNLDATYYMSSTENQILSLPNDIVSGYSNRVINAGEVQNKGVELVLTGKPVQKADFDWNVMVNWSMNRNEIMELNDNLKKQTLSTVWQASLIGTVGGRTTDLWGPKFLRDEVGNQVFENGIPVRTSTSEYIGNIAADWKAGLTNTVRYKDFRLSFTLDGQHGGLIYSGTYNRSSWDGFTTNTIPGRDEGFIIGEGVMRNIDGTYSKNTVKAATNSYYSQYHQIAEAGVFEATFIKIRDVSLTYTMPYKFAKSIYATNLSFTIFGRNLAVFDKFPFWDPEGGTMNGTVFVPGLEMAPMPYTATYGLTLKADF